MAAAQFSEAISAQLRNRSLIQAAHDELDQLIKPGDELARPLQRAVRDTMWENCGVVRDQARLEKGLQKIGELEDAAQHVDVRPSAEGYKALARNPGRLCFDRTAAGVDN